MEMSNPVNSVGSTLATPAPPVSSAPGPAEEIDPASKARGPSAQSETAAASAVSPGASGPTASNPIAADLRLIIEESDTGHYVYTVVDRRTGDVVSQAPREEVERLKDQPGYKAGDFFRGQA
jgi:hypothetical protein